MSVIERLSSVVLLAAALLSGTAAFAVNSSFLNESALTNLTDEDRKLQLDAAMGVLEDAAASSSREWNNPSSGASGQADTLGNFTSDDGLHCRKLRLRTTAKGVESRFEFPVCKKTDGDWFIASGMKLTRTSDAKQS